MRPILKVWSLGYFGVPPARLPRQPLWLKVLPLLQWLSQSLSTSSNARTDDETHETVHLAVTVLQK